MAEFNRGDIVTFRAYVDQNIKAKVIEVINANPTEYKLEGVEKPLISITTGRSIKESKEFKCPIKFPFKWSD